MLANIGPVSNGYTNKQHNLLEHSYNEKILELKLASKNI